MAGQLVGESLRLRIARLTLAERARREPRSPAAAEPLRDVALLRNVFASQGLLALFDAPWLAVYVGVIWLAHPALGTAAASGRAGDDRARSVDRPPHASRHRHRAARSGLCLALRRRLAHNAEVVQSLGMADALLARWSRLNAPVAALQGPLAKRSVAMAALARTARQAVQVLMLGLGAWLVITQQSSPGVMIAATVLLGRAPAPVEQLVASWRVLADGRAALLRLRALLDSNRADESARMELPAPDGRLQAHGLTWRAPNWAASSSRACRSTSLPANRSRSSGPAAPASPRCCACSPACGRCSRSASRRRSRGSRSRRWHRRSSRRRSSRSI